MLLEVQGYVLEKTTAAFLLSFRKSVISVSGFLVTFCVFSTPSPHSTIYRMTNDSALPTVMSCGNWDWDSPRQTQQAVTLAVRVRHTRQFSGLCDPGQRRTGIPMGTNF